MNAQTTGPCDDLNRFLEILLESGDLIAIQERLDSRFEIPAVLGILGEREGPAAIFTNVSNFPGHVVAGNILGHTRRRARALGVPEEELRKTYLERKRARILPAAAEEAPVKQVRVDPEKIDVLGLLPALTHHEKDASPYLTCAVTFARSPETGRQTMGVHRIQLQSARRMAICLATPPLSFFLKAAGRMNRPLEVAVVIGPDPATLIASVTRCPGGDDKIEIAGGLRRQPVLMTQCDSVDLQVPASVQYLIEGVIRPGYTAPEGPFGESTGIYVREESPVIEVTALSRREKPIFQSLQTWSSEDDALLNLCFGSDLWEDVRPEFPMLQDLHMVPGTLCAHAVAKIVSASRPVRRSLMAALLTRNFQLKKVILVDEDIDIRNPREVEWAVANRFQAGRDLLVLTEMEGSPIDPSASAERASSKIGVDATLSKGEAAAFDRIKIPAASLSRAEEILRRVAKTGK